MKYLLQNGEPERRLDIIIRLARLESEPTIQALRDHLQKGLLGLNEARSAALNKVELSNFNRVLKKLNSVAADIEEVKEIDYQHLKSRK